MGMNEWDDQLTSDFLESLESVEEAVSEYWKIPEMQTGVVKVFDADPGQLEAVDIGGTLVNPLNGKIVLADGTETGELYVFRLSFAQMKASTDARATVRDGLLCLRELIAEAKPTKTFEVEGEITVTYHVTATIQGKDDDEVRSFVYGLHPEDAISDESLGGGDEDIEITDSMVELSDAEMCITSVTEE